MLTPAKAGWDGAFHVVTWLSILIGLSILYSRVPRARGTAWRSGALWGWILVGWGLFNVVEGLVDHQLLGIHHVRTGPHQLRWDLAFLAFGAALIAVGWAVQRAATRGDAATRTDRPLRAGGR